MTWVDWFRTSARIVPRTGPFAGYAEYSYAMLNVLRMHRAVAVSIDAGLAPAESLAAAIQAWDGAVAWPRPRRSELPGQRSGSDGDHRLADGLLHDRR